MRLVQDACRVLAPTVMIFLGIVWVSYYASFGF